MSDIGERMSKVETTLQSHDKEIESLRESRHVHNGMIHNHTGILSGIEGAVKALSVQMKQNNAVISKFESHLASFKGMVVATIFLISVFTSFTIYVGGTLLKWW